MLEAHLRWYLLPGTQPSATLRVNEVATASEMIITHCLCHFPDFITTEFIHGFRHVQFSHLLVFNFDQVVCHIFSEKAYTRPLQIDY